MRLELDFLFINNKKELNKAWINKHAVQGLIYRQLQDTEFADLHNQSVSKLFTFSDWFSTNEKNVSRMFLSSPNDNLINLLEKEFTKQLGKLMFKGHVLIRIKKLKLRIWDRFRTGSPIVIIKKNHSKTEYYSFKDKTLSLSKFEKMIRDGGVAKYQAVTGEDDFYIEKPLFEELSFKKEVAVPIKKKGKSFPIIGSQWDLLRFRKDQSLRKFYEWLVDAGLGMKTSLGFGFLQNYPKTKKKTLDITKIRPPSLKGKQIITKEMI